MTNAEIILGECAMRGITEDVHTYARWKQLGYIVKKGQKALFSTTLWKHTDSKKEAEKEDVDGEQSTGRMYMHKAYLFGASQVEKMEEK